MVSDFTKFLEESGLSEESMEEAVASLPSPLSPDSHDHYYVGPSPIHGQGVFARRDVDGFIGILWTDSDWYEAARYINHSNHPNCYPLRLEDATLLIGKAIENEELTVDYRDFREIL